MAIVVRTMSAEDYPQVISLWSGTEGIGLSESDTEPSFQSYLRRNPESSFVALEEGTLVGAVLCGHDGRRGFIHHLCVASTHLHKGLGRMLVERCFTALEEAQIVKCHLFVFKKNREAQRFWSKTGWTTRDDLVVMSRMVKSRDSSDSHEDLA